MFEMTQKNYLPTRAERCIAEPAALKATRASAHPAQAGSRYERYTARRGAGNSELGRKGKEQFRQLAKVMQGGLLMDGG